MDLDTIPQTTEDRTPRAIGTPDDLIAACRIAQAQNKKQVVATKRCMGYFLGESKDAGFTMMGLHVIEEGREKEYYAGMNQTIEQVNFPKA